MSEIRQLFLRVLAQPAGMIGLAIVVLTLLVALCAPLLAPYDPAAIAMAKRFAAPSLGHWLGTDHLGRDNLSRMIFGARLALTIAVPAVLCAFLAGLLLGLAAGYIGGWLDRVLVVIADTFLSFPSVILGLALLTLVGQSVLNTTLVIALSLFPYYLRLARGLALSTKHQPYIKAERSLGAGSGRIMFVHLLPNMLPPLLVVVAMDVPSAIVIEAGLAFLGLGVPPPAPDWGVLLNEGFVNVAISAWPLAGPLMAIVFVTTGFTLLGETFRDIADPRLAGLRRRPGRFLMRRAR
ncbi:MAG TPA: ABC transporter permease [Nordella sp.]|nr:ABC transporter permease [Nordella sp.]